MSRCGTVPPSARAWPAGRPTPYADVPYFWSDQYGLRLQMYGRGRADDEIVTRAGATAESFLAFWLHGGRLAAAGIGAAKDLRAAKSLIEARAEVPPAVLADQGSSLRARAIRTLTQVKQSVDSGP
jgi:3-phenylpropionate/trans-cinnamate dioxygenase ferredoxin reductase component